MLNLADKSLLREECLIDGKWVGSDQKIAVTNPATGAHIANVPKFGVAHTRQAIEAANRAGPAWRARTAKERSAVLNRWFDLIMANQEDLARIMTAEQGKPLPEARGEIA